MKQNKYQIKCKKCEENIFNVFSCLDKNMKSKSKGKNQKWQIYQAMGQGGVCEKWKCKKKQQVRPSPRRLVFNLQQQFCQKRAPFPPCSNILIPGLLAQTYNMKNIKHQATIPYIPRTWSNSQKWERISPSLILT